MNKEEPPNFRCLERNNCLQCKHSVFKHGLYICNKYYGYIIEHGDNLPTRYICDDFEVDDG